MFIKFVIFLTIVIGQTVSCAEMISADYQVIEPGDVIVHHFEETGPLGTPIAEMTKSMALRYIAPELGMAELEPIGHGGFATVYKARDSNGQIWAIKIQSAPNNDYETLADYFLQWENEVMAIHAAVGHPNFVQFKQVVFLKHHSAVADIPTHMAMATEYLPLDVAEMISINPESYSSEASLRNLMVQHLKAISFLHSQGLVHQDIKTENSMLATRYDKTQLEAMSTEKLDKVLSTVTYKVVDFGLAERLESPTSDSYFGSMQLMAPEKFQALLKNRQNDNFDHVFDAFAAELYTIGCVGVHAASPETYDAYMENCDPKADEPLGSWFHVTVETGMLKHLDGTAVLDAIIGLVEPNPWKRLTLEQALQMLTDN